MITKLEGMVEKEKTKGYWKVSGVDRWPKRGKKVRKQLKK